MMFHVIGWFVVLSLLALWSLAAWAFHALATWAMTNAGALASGTATLPGLRLPDWLAPWVSPELAQALDALAAGLAPAIQAMIGWAPALAGGLSVAVWVVWAIGAALLVLCGVLLSGLVAVIRRNAPRANPPGGPAAAAH